MDLHISWLNNKKQEPGEDPTPLVHRVASLLKRWLLEHIKEHKISLIYITILMSLLSDLIEEQQLQRTVIFTTCTTITSS